MLETVREILGNSISIEFSPVEADVHYRLTPYSFAPKLGQKLIGRTYVDMGQGLLECLQALYKEMPRRDG